MSEQFTSRNTLYLIQASYASVKFAKSLIKADDKVSDQEHDYYMILKNQWSLN